MYLNIFIITHFVMMKLRCSTKNILTLNVIFNTEHATVKMMIKYFTCALVC